MTLLDQFQSLPLDRAALCGACAYLIGCFPTGYLIVRLRTGRDIRDVESGATGARNVSRVLGHGGFVATAVGDAAKGALAVWVARAWGGGDPAAMLALLGVVAGHIWPAPLRFRGGKGVATSLGGLLVFDWRLAVAFALSFTFLYLLARRFTLVGMIAFTLLPLAAHGLDHDISRTLMVGGIPVLVLWAHRVNITEEFNGKTTDHPASQETKS